MSYFIQPKKEKTEQPACLPGKAHYWKLGEPRNGRTPARCKRCRAKTVFVDDTWTLEMTGRFSSAAGPDRLPRYSYRLAEEWVA